MMTTQTLLIEILEISYLVICLKITDNWFVEITGLQGVYQLVNFHGPNEIMNFSWGGIYR